MTITPPPGTVIKVKPTPDVYTLLLILAIVFLTVTVAIVMHNLMTTYGMTFAELFKGQEVPV